MIVLVLLLFGLLSQTTISWTTLRQQHHHHHRRCLRHPDAFSTIRNRHRLHVHASIISSPTSISQIPHDDDDDDDDDNVDKSVESPQRFASQDDDEDDGTTTTTTLSDLCQQLRATPNDLLRFDYDCTSGVRGVYLNRSVKENETIVKLPLEACLTDDAPPNWLVLPDDTAATSDDQWAIRLAACWIDVHLQQQKQDNAHANLWLSLLPEPQMLRATLPVHWPEEVVANARSTSLELAVDSAYFVRAEAVQTLVQSLQQAPSYQHSSHSNLNDLAHRALDVVQTRTCRLSTHDASNDDACRRVLAPIFDFINHAPQCANEINENNGSCANAHFGREDDCLVVRALHDLEENQEVLIDYGESARPAWKCLLNYGFVPEFDNGNPEDNLAEVYMMGQRYEVTAETIPVEMVMAAATTSADVVLESDDELIEGKEAGMEEDNNDITLTHDEAMRIADRCEEVGFFLLLEPELDPYQDFDETDNDDDAYASLTPNEVLSHSLAASLRWSQHKVLMTCAKGLRRFATEEDQPLE